jgi:hypothetical protein
MNLSLGERPVWLPVVALNTPLAANWPSPSANARSTKTLGGRFQWIVPKLTKPYSSSAFLLIIIVIVDLSFGACLSSRAAQNGNVPLLPHRVATQRVCPEHALVYQSYANSATRTIVITKDFQMSATKLR